MNPIQTWGEAVTNSLLGLWGRFVNFFPTLLGAVLVFVLGILIASVIGKVVERIVRALRIDGAIERLTISEKLREHGIEITLSSFMGKIFQWFLILVFLMAATDIIGLDQVTSFLNSVLIYLPNVVVATIVLTIAFLLGNLMYAIVRSSTKAAGVMSAALLATLIRWAIVTFGLFAALIQLGIATSLVNTLFTGLVAAFSLAIGLAFGLGGRDEAALILKKIREEITDSK